MQEAERVSMRKRRGLVARHHIVRNGGNVPRSGRLGSESAKWEERSH
jgi:hypothetical protein